MQRELEHAGRTERGTGARAAPRGGVAVLAASLMMALATAPGIAQAPHHMHQLARHLHAVIRGTPVQLVTGPDDLLRLRIPVDYLFAPDATQLRAEAPPRLDPLVTTLLKADRMTLVVAGHSDALGTREFNAAFTLQRANAVADYLRLQGIVAERVGARGAGEMERVESTEDSPAARARNRRIEIEIRPARPSLHEAS